MPMAATKTSRFFIFFTALLLDKSAGYKAKETRTTTGRLTRPEVISDLDNFLSKGPMKSDNPPTETDQASWIKLTSKETATAQQPTRDQDLHHSRHFFDHDYTGFDGTFAHTLKETTKTSRWTAYTTIHPDQTRQIIPIPAQERKQEMKFYLDTRTPPQPLPPPTTSKVTAQRKRNAKPPLLRLFSTILLLHLQKTNKKTTSHPRPIKPPTYDKSCYTRSKLRINRQSALGFYRPEPH
jgi:hypothetical protein